MNIKRIIYVAGVVMDDKDLVKLNIGPLSGLGTSAQ